MTKKEKKQLEKMSKKLETRLSKLEYSLQDALDTWDDLDKFLDQLEME